jgi:formylmethanofuran dehydrogenase subunit B
MLATCLGCGCTCDDIDIVVEGSRIVEAQRACAMGVEWFGDGRVPAHALVDGRRATLEAALDAAAALVARARRPLVYLAPDLSLEAQREAIALADRTRGALDGVASSGALGSIIAAQERGRAAATLGEIRNRADVVVFWGVDPSRRYPRFAERYAPDAVGLYVPAGRRSRAVVAVDVGEWQGPDDADVRVAIAPETEVATLTALRALVAAAPDAPVAVDDNAARSLAPWLLRGRYVAVVADGESHGVHDPDRAAALIALAQALNGPTRAALVVLRGGGNRSGAEAAATWQTGYPAAVDFSRGFPRYRPYDGSALARLAGGTVDAVVVAGAAAALGASLRLALTHVDCAIIGPRASEQAPAGTRVAIDTGVAGIHEGGTAVRLDDVPVPLRRVVEGPPAAGEVIRMLGERIASLQVRGRTPEPRGTPRT